MQPLRKVLLLCSSMPPQKTRCTKRGIDDDREVDVGICVPCNRYVRSMSVICSADRLSAFPCPYPFPFPQELAKSSPFPRARASKQGKSHAKHHYMYYLVVLYCILCSTQNGVPTALMSMTVKPTSEVGARNPPVVAKRPRNPEAGKL